MPYRLTIERAAAKALESLDAGAYRRVRAALAGLMAEPRPSGCKKLAGADDLWRIRAGDWRIVYAILDRELVVLVVRAAHRREVYR
jgi:mRNA interferase RelE/StbE